MVSMIVDARALGSAMFRHISVGKAVGRALAMTKSNRRRRHHKAKCCERRKNDRDLEPEPGREGSQHGLSVASDPAIDQSTGQEQLRQAVPAGPSEGAAKRRLTRNMS